MHDGAGNAQEKQNPGDHQQHPQTSSWISDSLHLDHLRLAPRVPRHSSIPELNFLRNAGACCTTLATASETAARRQGPEGIFDARLSQKRPHRVAPSSPTHAGHNLARRGLAHEPALWREFRIEMMGRSAAAGSARAHRLTRLAVRQMIEEPTRLRFSPRAATTR